MYLSEYQRAAWTTAIFPASAGFYYPALGLAGEIGEIANKAKKIVRGDVSLEERRDDLKKELGDVMWYVAGVASAFALNLKDIADQAAFGEYHEDDLYSAILKLESYAGLICGIAQDVRTHGLSEHRRALIKTQLLNTLQAATRLCVLLKADLGEICKDNIQKLLQRKETGTLRGDGDNREQTAPKYDESWEDNDKRQQRPRPKAFRIQAKGTNGWYDTGDSYDTVLPAVEFADSEAVRNGRQFRVIDSAGAIIETGVPSYNDNSKAAEDLFPRRAA